jgi:hypothetical protein
MDTTVERNHWWAQLPFSGGVAAVLVLALLVGAGFAATQVRGQDVTIAGQAATISQQTATIRQAQEQIHIMRSFAEIDRAIMAAYITLQADHAAMAQALLDNEGEIDEVYDLASASAQRTQRRIASLKEERQWLETVLYSSPGFNY